MTQEERDAATLALRVRLAVMCGYEPRVMAGGVRVLNQGVWRPDRDPGQALKAAVHHGTVVVSIIGGQFVAAIYHGKDLIGSATGGDLARVLVDAALRAAEKWEDPR